nr:hypothetical protein CFP56_58590 [Quercus suber]
MFIWRACRNAMSMKQALMRRTIIGNSICDRCQAEVKDPPHALWTCTELNIVWVDQSLWEFRNSIDFADFKDLVSWIIAKAAAARIKLDEFHTTRQGLELPRQRVVRSAQNQWLPPPMDMVKINFDGATCPKKKKASIGVVVRDVNGLVLASCAKIKHQPYKAMEIESLATATTLSFAANLGF